MNPQISILCAGDTTWLFDLVAVDTAGSGSMQETAATVAGALEANGYKGEGIILAIPSQWCLCAPIKTDGLPARNRQQALAYRLEEKLPLAAEDVIADFLPVAAGDAETLGVCVEKQKLSPLVDALESAGVAIAAVCPAAMLALQNILPAMGSVDAAVLPASDGDGFDLFVLRNGKLRAWYWAANAMELRRHLSVELYQRTSPATVAVAQITPEISSALNACRILEAPSPDPISLASSILSGKRSAWIDLRRNGLAASDPLRAVRTPLTFAIASAAMCVLCLCGAMLWRANQYNRLASEHADQQQTVFRHAFPAEATPIDVLSRLNAEQRRLHGLNGDSSAPMHQNGLVTLRELITHLPAADALRYRVLEIRLDQNLFTLEGQTAGHGEADAIAGSLRTGGMFKVDAPKTEQLGDAADAGSDKSVTFTITGTTDMRRSAP